MIKGRTLGDDRATKFAPGATNQKRKGGLLRRVFSQIGMQFAH